MSGYIGTVEAQGCGTLHFYVVGWLKDTPTSTHMKGLLHSEHFRKQITDYITANIKSDTRSATGKQLKLIERQKAVSYSCSDDPRGMDYIV